MDPWFKFYAADYLLDEQVDVLPLEAQAILVRLWCLCWRSSVIPDSADVLALRAKVDSRSMRKHWPALRGFFEIVEGGLSSPRMERERSESRAKSEAHRLGAAKTNAKRWGQRPPSDSLSDHLATSERLAKRITQRVAKVSPSDTDTEKESTPLAPLTGGTAPGKARKAKAAQDCSRELLALIQEVYRAVPKEHPLTGEQVHKGPQAAAARAFQRCVDEGDATPEELHMAGLVYYAAEALERQHPETLRQLPIAANRDWDTRNKAMMHVSTFFGPEKRAYQQMLPLARKVLVKLQPAPQQAAL